MNPYLSFPLLLVMHFMTGYGIMRLLRIRPTLPITGPVAIITGVGVASAIPFLLQLAFISITTVNVFTVLGVVSLPGVLFMIKGWKKLPWSALRFPALYEWPALLIIMLIMFISVWRCYYNPVMPRDMLSGAEVIANYTIQENTFINSVFMQDLGYNNNPFKPLSVCSLQVIYKMAGFPFGQVWLSVIFVSFIVFLYRVISRKLHPVFAGILILLFLAIPEMYAYTYMALFDYSNAVFFTLSCFFLFEYKTERPWGRLLFAGLLMAIATYLRPETLVLVMMLLPAIIFRFYKAKAGWKTYVSAAFLFCLFPVLAYWVPNSLYNYHYLPVHYNISGEMNKNLTDLGPLWKRFSDINTVLLFSDYGIILYGYLLYFFLAVFVTDFAKKRSFTPEAAGWLFAFAVVYTGLAVAGFLAPLMDLRNTTKRGLFKIFPLILFYMANSPLLQAASTYIHRWLSGALTKEKAVKSGKHKTMA